MKTRLLSAAGAILAFMSTQSIAAPVTFFGEDVQCCNLDPTQAPFTNATNTANSFLSNLTGVGTETFDSYSTLPSTLTFPGAGTATLSGNPQLASGNDGFGRYPFSGAQYLTLDTGSFNVGFSSPIAAFGFYTTDVGDFGAHLTLQLTDASNVVSTLSIPNTVGSGGSTSGSNFYFGFYDLADTYTNIAFLSDAPSSGADVFGFDNLTVGSLQQITPNPTPVPAALPLFAGGGGLLGYLGWRRKRKAPVA